MGKKKKGAPSTSSSTVSAPSKPSNSSTPSNSWKIILAVMLLLTFFSFIYFRHKTIIAAHAELSKQVALLSDRTKIIQTERNEIQKQLDELINEKEGWGERERDRVQILNLIATKEWETIGQLFMAQKVSEIVMDDATVR